MMIINDFDMCIFCVYRKGTQCQFPIPVISTTVLWLQDPTENADMGSFKAVVLLA